MIADRVTPADGSATRFGLVQTYGTKPNRRLFEVQDLTPAAPPHTEAHPPAAATTAESPLPALTSCGHLIFVGGCEQFFGDVLPDGQASGRCGRGSVQYVQHTARPPKEEVVHQVPIPGDRLSAHPRGSAAQIRGTQVREHLPCRCGEGASGQRTG